MLCSVLCQVEELLDTIVDQFKGLLPKNPWMDYKTIVKATEKVEAISYKVGYPKYIRDPEELDEHYEEVSGYHFSRKIIVTCD